MSDAKNEKTSSSKSKGLLGIIIALLVLALIGSGVYALNKGKSTGEEPAVNSTISEVSDITEKSIRFKDDSLNIKVGETVELEIIAEPDNSEDGIYKLKSDNPAIAKVDSTGKLTAVSPGSTTVTATLKSDESITASLTVTVAEDDTASASEKNSDSDRTAAAANAKRNQSENNTDTDTKKTDVSSAVTSSRRDSDKDAVSSAASSAGTTSSSTSSSSYVNSSTVTQSYSATSTSSSAGNTTQQQPVQQTEEKPNYSNEPIPNNFQYIDPSSVGKSIPIGYVQTDEKKVSISFDASWGNDKTQLILDTLEQYNIKSTFFLVGVWVRAYPDDVKKIAAAGHDIGNHSNTHPDLTQLDIGSIRSELETCSSDIEALTGKRPILFRHPYGAYDNRVIGTALGMGMNCIQWDVDTLDWTNNSGAEICARIRSKIKNGSIILMHNAGGSTADSLPMIIQTIHDLGYEIVPISELISQGDYIVDYTGKLVPLNPPEPSVPEEPEKPEETPSENESSQPNTSSIESDEDKDATDNSQE